MLEEERNHYKLFTAGKDYMTAAAIDWWNSEHAKDIICLL
jgi:hypothetical protein